MREAPGHAVEESLFDRPVAGQAAQAFEFDFEGAHAPVSERVAFSWFHFPSSAPLPLTP
jgi:hypothetical protein